MFIVGLTGGIGCGKTTVTHLFQKLGTPVIDADDIAQKIVRPGQAALGHITSSFGQQFLQQDGTLNRQKLRDHVFKDSSEREKLEKILHPLIFNEMEAQLSGITAPYGIMSIPLLFETNFQNKVDRILVIDCLEEAQIQRVMNRDNTEQAKVESILQNQCSRKFRRQHADDIILNEGPIEQLTRQVYTLHQSYLKHALVISTRKTP